jgi:Na+/melibiose symporter-like transporter
MELSCYLSALIWGGVWAWCLQFTRWGQFLARRRTWFTVVVGIGGDLLLVLWLLLEIPLDDPLWVWVRICAVIGLSAIGIIIRSLVNEYQENQELIDGER